MSTTYTPDASTYHPTPRVLTDDDDQIATSYNACFEEGYDNIAFVRAELTAETNAREAGDYNLQTAIPGAGGWGTVALDLGSVRKPPAGWAEWGVFGPPCWVQNDPTPGYTLWIPLQGALNLIDGATNIVAFSCLFKGASGHGTTLPTMPSVALVSVPIGAVDPSGAPTAYAPFAGPPTGTTVATYEAPILFVATLAEPVVYSSSRLYFLRVTGESGTGYVAGLRLQAASITVHHVPEL